MTRQEATEIAANITAQLMVHCTIVKSDQKSICYPDDLTEAIADAILAAHEAGAKAMLERCVKVIEDYGRNCNSTDVAACCDILESKLREG